MLALNIELDKYRNLVVDLKDGRKAVPPKPESLLTTLLIWRKWRKELPELAKIARDMLAIQATSVPSERIFSRSKRINMNRLRLDPNKLGKFVMSAANVDKLLRTTIAEEEVSDVESEAEVEA